LDGLDYVVWIIIGLFIIGALFIAWYAVAHFATLEKAGCEHTPVDWPKGTFYIIEDGDYACPYKNGTGNIGIK